MKIIIICLSFLVVTLTVSCEKWLDVQPRTKIKSDDLLKTEIGFQEAMFGVYTLAKGENLYGRQLSFAFTDAIANEYTLYNNEVYKEVSQWNYMNPAVRSQIDNIWGSSYNLIANINNILDQIDAQKDIFTKDNYQIIKGEMLGLRGFVYLDILRLFGSSDLTLPAIPVIKTLTTSLGDVYTGKAVVELIDADLKEAAELLSKEPIVRGEKNNSKDPFLNTRQMRMNYYAVKATQARLYMWAGDKTAALEAAQEVIAISDITFPWVESDMVSTSDKTKRDYTFSSEHIFCVNVQNLKTISDKWFYGTTDRISPSQLYQSSYDFERIFEKANVGASDYRLLYTAQNYEVPFYGYIIQKYNQTGIDNKRIPLIRISEMYYIASECYVGVDNEKAEEYLNLVRRHRGITTPVSSTLQDDMIVAEIQKEYRKEFKAEGQFFYFCKRRKMVNFPAVTYKPATEAVYVLPKPDREIEFGKEFNN